MRKLVTGFGILLAILCGLLPVGALLARLAGFDFWLFHNTAYAVICAVVSLVAAVTAIISEEKALHWSVHGLYALLPLLALVNWMMLLFAEASVVVAVCMLVCFLCAMILAIRCARPKPLEIIGLVLAGLAIIPSLCLSFFMLIFGNIAENTVVSTIPSPDGTHYAELVDSNQGAMGGATIVYVYEDIRFDAGLFCITKNPTQVYLGEWGEFMDMQIEWKDDQCLLINGQPFSLP